MSQTITASAKLTLLSNFDNVLDLSTVRDPISLIWTNALTNGTGADKAQVAWHDQRVITTGANDDIDLAGSLSCAFGVVTFTKIKLIAIKVVTTTAGYVLSVGGASANPIASIWGATGDIVKVGPGGLLLLTNPSADGYAVTAGSADVLRLTNPAGGSMTIDIWVVGEGSVA